MNHKVLELCINQICCHLHKPSYVNTTGQSTVYAYGNAFGVKSTRWRSTPFFISQSQRTFEIRGKHFPIICLFSRNDPERKGRLTHAFSIFCRSVCVHACVLTYTLLHRLLGIEQRTLYMLGKHSTLRILLLGGNSPEFPVTVRVAALPIYQQSVHQKLLFNIESGWNSWDEVVFYAVILVII